MWLDAAFEVEKQKSKCYILNTCTECRHPGAKRLHTSPRRGVMQAQFTCHTCTRRRPRTSCERHPILAAYPSLCCSLRLASGALPPTGPLRHLVVHACKQSILAGECEHAYVMRTCLLEQVHPCIYTYRATRTVYSQPPR